MHGDVQNKWLAVNKAVFNSDVSSLKSEHYKEDDYSKIKGKFDAIVKKMKSLNGWGDFCGGTNQNLSGYTGDMNEVI